MSRNTVPPATNTSLPDISTEGPPLGSGRPADLATPAEWPTVTEDTIEPVSAWGSAVIVIAMVSSSDRPPPALAW